MKESVCLNENDILSKGIEILLKELGPVETVRFLNIPREKRLESVKRHRLWQKDLDKNEFLKKIFE